jgi:uncharacterized protein
MSEQVQYEVRLNEDANRFEVVENDRLAKITYVMMGPSQIIFTHTIVPFSMKGQGIASQMAKYALDYAREQNLKVVPQCPFVRAYIERHKEYQDLVESSK